jgi:phosphotransferase system IIA component
MLNDSPPPEVTFTAARTDFVITVDAQGVLEAKKAHNIMTPQLARARPTLAWLPPEGTYVKKGDIVVELEAAEIERGYIIAMDELEIEKADEQKVEAELTLQRVLLESQQKDTEASLAASRLQLNKMVFEPARIQEIRRLEISRDELELQRIDKKLASTRNIANEERKRLQLKVNQAESKVTQCEQYLNQLQLKAPVDGFVEYAQSWFTDEKVEVGGQLYPNMPILMIPDLAVMQVNIQLAETDAHMLTKGQKTAITVPSLDNLELNGEVSKVAKVAKPVKRDSKVKKVEVIVEVDSTQVELVPGLTANCRIIVEELNDVITIPRECVFEKDSIKVVYVLQGERYTPFVITIEKYSEDFVAIAGDLQGGERCALKEPHDSIIAWPERFELQRDLEPVDTVRAAQPADSLTNGRRTLPVGGESKIAVQKGS